MTDISARAIDPFGFFNGYASCIHGLGGPDKGPDPAYAFHTPYMEYRPGPLVFSIRFDGLEASFGELVIHVNSFVPGSGANALLVTMARVPMTELAISQDEVLIKINALPDMGFAVFGYFPEGTDARATGLSITVDELGHIEEPGVPADALVPTRFGASELMRPYFLIGDQPPVFVRPVSQIITTRQLDEPAFADRLRQLPQPSADPVAQWQKAFILQALDCYGMLRPGARGLALGVTAGELGGTMLAQGCAVTIALDAARDHAMEPRKGIAITPIAFDEDLPPELRGFDFAWSIAPAGAYNSAGEARAFIDRSLRALRPGGVAVHLIDLIGERGTSNSPRGGLTRMEIESLALLMISRGHEAAQLNFANHGYGSGTDDVANPFGLILRRGKI